MVYLHTACDQTEPHPLWAATAPEKGRQSRSDSKEVPWSLRASGQRPGQSAGERQLRRSMKIRTVTFVGTLGLFSAAILLAGCGSNTPSANPGSGGAPGSGGSGSGGSGSGGSGSGGTTPATGSGGSTSPVTGAGGATSPATGSGGNTSPVTGAGGYTSTTTATGSGGSSAAGGNTGGGTFTPLCTGLATGADAGVAKGGSCTDSDPQICYKTCGPESKGYKSETCSGGTYAEQSGCSFPTDGNYACYKLPTTADPTCPTTAPQANTACTVAACVVCGGTDTAQTTGYLDSSGAAKAGFCVCPVTSTGTPGKWTCASSTAWPCPSSNGC